MRCAQHTGSRTRVFEIAAVLLLVSLSCHGRRHASAQNTTPQQHATCRLSLQGYRKPAGGAVGVAAAELNCSSAAGPGAASALQIGINSTYMLRHAAHFKGVQVVPDMECQVQSESASASARPLFALLYFCGSYSVRFEQITIRNVFLEYKQLSFDTAVILVGGDANATFDGGIVAGNKAGSAIALSGRAHVTVQNMTCTRNTGRLGTAIMARGNSDTVLLNSIMEANSATQAAGIYLSESARLRADNVTFRNNSANWGGAIHATDAAELRISSSMFVRNKAKADGGSMYLTSKAQAYINNSTFVSNSADQYGAALYMAGFSNADLDSTNITNSTASLGAGISITNFASLHTSACQFLGNRAKPDNQAGGGAIAAYEFAQIALSNTSLGHNAASFGGAVCLEGATQLTAERTTIFNNTAWQAGAGVQAGNQASVLLTRASRFHANNAPVGAALAAKGGANVTITGDSTVEMNWAARSGGGLSIQDSARVLIEAAILRRNRADSDGGAVHANGQSVLHVSKECILHDNIAKWGGGVYIGRNQIVDSASPQLMISNNTAMYGADIAVAAAYLTVLGSSVVESFVSGSGTSQSILPVQLNVSGQNGLPGEGYIVQAELNGTLILGVNRSDSSGIVVMNLPIRQPPGHMFITFSLLPSEVQTSMVGISSVNVSLTVRTCIPGEVAPRPDICQACQPGTFSLNPTNKSCDDCPENADCAGGTVITPLQGWWHSSPQAANIHRCPNPSACQGNRTLVSAHSANNTCSGATTVPGACGTIFYANLQCSSGYTGNLCAMCARGYAPFKPFACKSCMQKGITIGLFVSGAVVLLGLIKLVCLAALFRPCQILNDQTASSVRANCQDPEMPNGIAAAASTPQADISIKPKSSVNGAAATGTAAGGHCEVPGCNAVQPLALLKPFVLYMQYMLIIASLQIDWPAPLYYPFWALGWLWAPASTITVSLSCVLPQTTKIPAAALNLLVYICMPVAMLLLSWLMDLSTFAVEKLRNSGASGNASFRQRCMKSAIVVSFFFFPSVLLNAFSMFACVHIDSPAAAPFAPAAVGSFWLQDTSQLCLVGYHKPWAFGLGLPVLLLICTVFPVLIVLAACSSRSNPTHTNQPEQRCGFLLLCYRAAYSWWDAVVILQTAALVVICVFAFNIGAYAQGLVFCTALALMALALLMAKPYASAQASRNMSQALFCLFITCAAGMATVVYDGSNSQVFRVVISGLTLVINVVFVVHLVYQLITLWPRQKQAVRHPAVNGGIDQINPWPELTAPAAQ